MPKRHTAVLPAGVELGPELGKGSFGTVYKAVWQHQIVAAKVSSLEIVLLYTIVVSCNPLPLDRMHN